MLCKCINLGTKQVKYKVKCSVTLTCIPDMMKGFEQQVSSGRKWSLFIWYHQSCNKKEVMASENRLHLYTSMPNRNVLK